MPSAHTRLTATLAAVLLTAAAAAGCSSSSHAGSSGGDSGAPTAASVPASGQAQVVITNFAYQPADLTVSPGQKITVVNHDSTVHTLTATGGHGFDTGKINPGADATITAPTTPGSYPYICAIHQFMHGTITVRS